jgi:hypothetical protein
MSRNSSFAFALTSLLLISTAHAQDTATPPFQGANPAALRTVSCHGISSVPMTADAEQALPLKLVANVKCGEQVLVLSGAAGYTVNVQTADGRAGYIASMYLKKVPPPPRTLDPANRKNGVARWGDGVQGCSQFMSTDGSLVESISLDGLTVQVSLYDTGWKFRAQVAISNEGTGPVNVDPSKFVLDDIGPNGKPLFYNDPAVLAKNATHQVLWSEANATPITLPPYARFHSSRDTEALVLAYRIPTDRPVTTTNYLLSHQQAENNAIDTQSKRTLVDYAKQVQALALKPGVVPPSELVSGAVWFDRAKNPPQLMLRIPIEGTSFEFPLSFKAQK